MPANFTGVPIHSLSAYPSLPDAFAAAVGPHEPMFGIPDWAGVVIFDPREQTVTGFSSNNNCNNDSDCPPDTTCVDHCCVDGVCKSDQLPQPCSVIDVKDPVCACQGGLVVVVFQLKNEGDCTRTFDWDVTQTAGAPDVTLTPDPAQGSSTLGAGQVADITVQVSVSANSQINATGAIQFTACNDRGSENCGSASTICCSETTTIRVISSAEISEPSLELQYEDPLRENGGSNPPSEITNFITAEVSLQPCDNSGIFLTVDIVNNQTPGDEATPMADQACMFGQPATPYGGDAGAKFEDVRVGTYFNLALPKVGFAKIEGNEPAGACDNIMDAANPPHEDNGRWVCVRWEIAEDANGCPEAMVEVRQMDHTPIAERDCEACWVAGCP